MLAPTGQLNRDTYIEGGLFFLKKYWFSVAFLISVGASGVFAGDVDPRFDGRWVGVETFQYFDFRFHDPVYVQATLGIADRGKALGITKGFAKGRYELVPEKSRGDTLVFRMPGTNGDKLLFLGRQHCTLTLSADGNTIKEAGTAIMLITKSGHGMGARVLATFHRQGHY